MCDPMNPAPPVTITACSRPIPAARSRASESGSVSRSHMALVIDVILPALDEEEALPWVLEGMPDGYRADGRRQRLDRRRPPQVARELGATVVIEPRAGLRFGVLGRAHAARRRGRRVHGRGCELRRHTAPTVADPVLEGTRRPGAGRPARRRGGAWPWHARLANRVLAAEMRRRTGSPVERPRPDAGRPPDRTAGSRPPADRRSGWPLEMVLAGVGWPDGGSRRCEVDYHPTCRPFEGDRHRARHRPGDQGHGASAGVAALSPPHRRQLSSPGALLVHRVSEREADGEAAAARRGWSPRSSRAAPRPVPWRSRGPSPPPASSRRRRGITTERDVEAHGPGRRWGCRRTRPNRPTRRATACPSSPRRHRPSTDATGRGVADRVVEAGCTTPSPRRPRKPHHGQSVRRSWRSAAATRPPRPRPGGRCPLRPALDELRDSDSVGHRCRRCRR